MEIKKWICSILVFSIFLTVFLQLLPGKQYEKYVRFFAGIIWILVVMQPVLQLFHLQEPLNGLVQMMAQYSESAGEETMQLDGFDEAKLQQYQDKVLDKQLSEAVCTAVKEKAAETGWKVVACEPVFTEEKTALQSVYLEITSQKAKGNSQNAAGNEEIGSQTAIERIRIQIQQQKDTGAEKASGEESLTEDKTSGQPERQEQKDDQEQQRRIAELRQGLAQNFQIPEDEIQIVDVSAAHRNMVGLTE